MANTSITPNDSRITRPDTAKFAETLRTARGQRRQADLAEAINKAQSVISAWENGTLEPRPFPVDIAALEDACGLTPGGLSKHLGWVPVTAAGSPEQAILDDPRFTPNQRRLLIALIAELAE